MKRIIIGSIVILMFLILAYMHGFKTHAYYSNTNKPTCTPTPTPVLDCDGDSDGSNPNQDDEGCMTPAVSLTLTPEVTESPTATPSGSPSATPIESSTGHSDSSGGGSGNGTPDASQPTCNVAFDAPILQGFSKDKNTGIQTYSWWKSNDTGVTKQSVVYGYAPGDERFGQVDIGVNTTSLPVLGLDSRKTSWFQVWVWKGSCVEKSNWFN